MANTRIAKKSVVAYRGDGTYLYDVPARDLTPEEWEKYKDIILACPQAAELYDLPETPIAATPVPPLQDTQKEI